MEKIYYKSSQFTEHMKNVISRMHVDDVFKPLLVDILLRRMYEYELTEEEAKRDLTSLVNNLEEIRICRLPRKHKDSMGVYYSQSKKIELSKFFVKECLKSDLLLDDLYEVLTHEVYHAISKDNFGNDRFVNKNYYTNARNNILLEAVTETAANRVVFTRDEFDLKNYRRNTRGYSDLTFIVPLLAATYGISEKEFLKKALRSRDDLIDMLSAHANEPREKTSKILDGIELNLAKIHDICYKQKGKSTKKEKSEVLSDALYSIAHICNIERLDRYKAVYLNSYKFGRAFVESSKYQHQKAQKIIDTEIRVLEKYYGVNVLEQLYDIEEESREDELSTLIQMDEVIYNRDNFKSDSELVSLLRFAQKGELGNFHEIFLSQKGIDINRKHYTRVEPAVSLYYEDIDFKLSDSWDNKKVNRYIRKMIPQYMRQNHPLKVLIRQTADDILGKNKKYLAEGESLADSDSKIERKPVSSLDYLKVDTSNFSKVKKNTLKKKKEIDMNKEVE